MGKTLFLLTLVLCLANSAPVSGISANEELDQIRNELSKLYERFPAATVKSSSDARALWEVALGHLEYRINKIEFELKQNKIHDRALIRKFLQIKTRVQNHYRYGASRPQQATRNKKSSIKTAPLNDSCSNATQVTDGTFTGTTFQATVDGSSSCDQNTVGPDVWYQYTATGNGIIAAKVNGNNNYPVLSVHTGCPGTTGNQLSCDSLGSGFSAQIFFAVTAGSTYWIRISGIAGSSLDYTLNLGPVGSISGHVLDSLSSTPLDAVQMKLFDVNGSFISATQTNPSGDYQFSALVPGTYYVIAESQAGYINEIFDNIACPFVCSSMNGTPIVISPGQNLSAVNFALDRGGSFSGNLTDAATGSPLPGQQLRIYDDAGSVVKLATTNAIGNYVVGALPAGDYFLITQNNLGYIDELYDDHSCPDNFSCSPNTGTPIHVNLASDTPGIDIGLVRGATISGTITDATTGTPLKSVNVKIQSQNCCEFFSTSTNELGNFLVGGLPSGTYFAKTENFSNYIDEIFDDIPCNGFSCDPTVGTPIAVTAPFDTPNINFGLRKGGIISGTMTDQGTGTPVAGFVNIYDGNGGGFGTVAVDFSGHYVIGGLPQNNYYAVSDNFGDYLDEIYNNVPCTNFCNPTSGTPIPVNLETETSGIDFPLTRGGMISGNIKDKNTHSALQDVNVLLSAASGNTFSTTKTDYLGNYVFGGLLPGTYYVRTEATPLNYLDEIYDDIPCIGNCDTTSGTPILVSAATISSGNDFELTTGGSISGFVSDSATGQGLTNGFIQVYDSLGIFVAVGHLNSGSYTVRALTSGTYYLIAFVPGPYLDELYDDIPCENLQCNALTGTPVPVIVSADTPNINFQIDHCPDLTPQPSTLPNGIVGQSYSVTLSVTGGAPPYQFSGFGFPPGLTLDQTGKLSGTPLQPGTFTFNISVNDTNFCFGNRVYTIQIGSSLFVEDFEDGILSSAWTYLGTWAELNGELQVTAAHKATALATPVFGGSSICTVSTTLESAGGNGSQVRFVGWRQDEDNLVELLMKENQDRWVLRQIVGGNIVAKASIGSIIDPNVPYNIKIQFDGTTFHVFVDGILKFVMQSASGSNPFGTFGYSVKRTSAKFQYLLIQ